VYPVSVVTKILQHGVLKSSCLKLYYIIYHCNRFVLYLFYSHFTSLLSDLHAI